jgi:hypothetical protein
MARSLTVVTWLWNDPEAKNKFHPEYVNAWARMVKANITADRIVCITDSPTGINECETYPIWDSEKVESPNWGRGKPQCYRRLRIFDPEIAHSLGDHILSVDLDTVIVDSLDPLFSDLPDFRIVGGLGKRNCYNGSMWIFKAGERSNIWTRFNPEEAVKASSIFLGSDQAWMRYILGEGEQVWGPDHGVYQFSKMPVKILPKGTRVVFFAGQYKPWHTTVQRNNRWIIQNWGEVKELEIETENLVQGLGYTRFLRNQDRLLRRQRLARRR